MTPHEHNPAPDQPDMAEADALIADLTMLVEAGLVVVHEHVLGPVRYGIAPARGARLNVRRVSRGRIRHPLTFSDEHRPGVGVGSLP
jgi:hypothetical protein